MSVRNRGRKNQVAAPCFRCGLPVAPGAGLYERHSGGWRVEHAHCASAAQKIKDRADDLPRAMKAHTP